MQSAYYRKGDKLFLWGGFNFYCVSSGVQGAADHLSIIRYFNNIWQFKLPESLYND